MPPTLKGIKNAFGRFASKFKRHTKKTVSTGTNSKYNNNNVEALIKHHRLAHEEYQTIFNNEDKIRTKLHIENIQRLISELIKKQEGCEKDLQISMQNHDAKLTEINELKDAIKNYELIVEDTNKQSQALAEELAECKGSQPRKLGSSGNQNTSSGRQTDGITSSGRQTDGITSPSGLRGVKSSSMRPSKLKRSRKPKLNTIYELNEPTESSSTRRARLAKQNEMKHSALNFIKANMNAYTRKRKAINNAKEAQNAAVIQAAANTKKAANNALRNKRLAHIGMMRRGG